MQVRLMAAHPQVQHLRGKVAVMRGPIVYCAEFPQIREDLFLTTGTEFEATFKKDLLGGLVVLEGKALSAQGRNRFVRLNADLLDSKDTVDRTKRLYTPLTVNRNVRFPNTGDTDVTLIPYYAWANRGPTCMTVWMPLAENGSTEPVAH